MNIKEKLLLLETMLDVKEGTLSEELELNDTENWDSLAIISFIALVNEKFGKSVSASSVKSAKTIGDLLKLTE